MTSKDEWDPVTLHFGPWSKGEEYSNLTSSLQISDVNVVTYPNEPQMIDVMHETELVLSSVSSAVTYQTIVPRMVAVPVVTYMWDDEQVVSLVKLKESHSAINAEELSHKWVSNRKQLVRHRGKSQHSLGYIMHYILCGDNTE